MLRWEGAAWRCCGERAGWVRRLLVAAPYLIASAPTAWLLPAAITAALLLTLVVTLWSAVPFAQQPSPVPSALAMASAIVAAGMDRGSRMKGRGTGG